MEEEAEGQKGERRISCQRDGIRRCVVWTREDTREGVDPAGGGTKRRALALEEERIAELRWRKNAIAISRDTRVLQSSWIDRDARV